MPSSPPSPPSSPLQAGRHGAHVLERLREALHGRYDVQGEIARGGMSTVYRARDLRHDRQVAIKVLPPDLATSIASERFVFEIRTAARLLHPHILGLIDSGDADGLLYYIMPHVDGESLRDRLTREGRLPVAEAARIVREVASALSHAHHHGVVHRDIKPENVLLVDGTHPVVADFGLALAILRSADRVLTRSSHIVGTVGYMSPEQAGSGADVDGRADIYSLGCMFFEMLAGHPPFEGHSPYAVIAQHISAKPPQLADLRPDVPAAIQRVVRRAMEKAPAQRYQTATELCADLDAAAAAGEMPWYARALGGTSTAARTRPYRMRIAAAAIVTALVAASGLVAVTPWGESVRARLGGAPGAALDTTRVAIFPLRRSGPVPNDGAAELLLHDAFARWSGIAVVDQLQVLDALTRRDVANPGRRELEEIAAEFGAGRFVHGDISAVGDSLRINASLHDAGTGSVLGSTMVKVSRASASATAPYEQLAELLLFRGASVEGRAESIRGTASAPARQAFLRGRAALHQWNLPAAESALEEAVQHDADFAAANLWLAQLRAWTADDPSRWRAFAERAVALEEQLTLRERLLGRALQHMAREEFPEACSRYAEVKRRTPHDFAATFGLGECIRRDRIVVPDARTRSGYRFRSSHFRAMQAYREAFELLPSAHKAFPGRAFARIRGFLMTSTTARMEGRALPPDTTHFRAAPSWEGDTLALIPYSHTFEMRAPERVVSSTSVEAVDRQRALFRDIAAGWRRAFPENAGPLEAMAVALELTGDATALDTLRLARRLATDEDQRVRLAVQEVWVRVKFALPDDARSLVVARELADSLLAARSATAASPEVIGSLAGLALLTGKVHLAASLAGRAATPLSGFERLPTRTVAWSGALVAYAAAGAPADSIRALESRIVSDVRTTVAAAGQRDALRILLSRAAALSFPVQRLASHSLLTGAGNPILDAQGALATGDHRAARAMLDRQAAVRALRRPADLTLDITYPGSWTLLALGDGAAAIRWIDPVLAALQMHPPDVVSRMANAGALLRAVALRAELAHGRGDAAGVRRWGGALAILWANADAPLVPAVQRLHALAATPTPPGTSR